jgi:hypothetical protein
MSDIQFSPEQCRALFSAARRVIQWRDKDEGLIKSLCDYEAVYEERFNEDEVIYEPLRAALALCGWRMEG